MTEHPLSKIVQQYYCVSLISLVVILSSHFKDDTRHIFLHEEYIFISVPQ
jgi:hypothetical protein